MDTPEGGAGLPPPDEGGGPEGPPPGPEGPFVSPCLVVSGESHACTAFVYVICANTSNIVALLSCLVSSREVSHLRTHGNQRHEVIDILARYVQSQTSISQHVAVAEKLNIHADNSNSIAAQVTACAFEE